MPIKHKAQGCGALGFLDGRGQRCIICGTVQSSPSRSFRDQLEQMLPRGRCAHCVMRPMPCRAAGLPRAGDQQPVFLDPQHGAACARPHAIFDRSGGAVRAMGRGERRSGIGSIARSGSIPRELRSR